MADQLAQLNHTLTLIEARIAAIPTHFTINAQALLNEVVAEVTAQLEAMVQAQLDQMEPIEALLEIPTDIASVITWITNLINTYIGPYAIIAEELLIMAEEITEIMVLLENKIASLSLDIVMPSLVLPQISAYLAVSSNLMPVGLLQAMTAAQMGALTVAQISGNLQTLGGNTFGNPGFTPTQVSEFSPVQVGALTQAQLYALTQAQVQVLLYAQIQAMPPASMSGVLTGTSPSGLHVAYFTPLQITYLTGLQIGMLTLNQLQSLSNTQISAFSPAQLPYLDFTKLTAAQLGDLTAYQVASVLADFTATEVVSLNPAVLATLTLVQLQQLPYTFFTDIQIAALSGAIQLVLFPLPPIG